MKQQQPDSIINTKRLKNKSYKWFIYIPLIALALFINSCKNDLEKIHLFDEEALLPDLSGKNITTLRSDSGVLTLRIFAPEIKQYDHVDEPFLEFPKGIEVYFLDSVQNIKTSIIAKYAIRYNEQYLYYARDSVVVSNVKTGEWIKSEEMYWNEKTGKVYSNKFTIINRSDGIIYGHKGFWSSQDFSDWVIKTSSGSIKLDDDKNEEEKP